MKTILNPTGGRPFKNEDAKLFEQFITIIESFLSEFSGFDLVIISGCEITGTFPNYDIAEGYVYADGSICKLNAFQSDGLPELFSVSSNDGTPREYFDGVTRNTINENVLTQDVGGSLSFGLDTPRLGDFLKNNLRNQEIDASIDTSVNVDNDVDNISVIHGGESSAISTSIVLPDAKAHVSGVIYVSIDAVSDGKSGDVLTFTYSLSSVLTITGLDNYLGYVLLKSDGETWRVFNNVALNTENFSSTNLSGNWSGSLRHKVDRAENIHLACSSVQHTGTINQGITDTIGTVPADYRPTGLIQWTYYEDFNDVMVRLSINTSGQVQIKPLDGNLTASFNLNFYNIFT